MDEKEYKATYQSINPTRCVFEKAINSRVWNCNRSVRFNLADREGVSCRSQQACARCNRLLISLREKARFALQLTSAENEPLPHNKELKIQNGGLFGIAKLATEEFDCSDIDTLLDAVSAQYGSLDYLPYSKIMRAVVAYQTRRHRKNRGK